MPPPPPQGDSGGNQSSLGILWIVGSIFAIGAIIWHFFGYYLKVFFIKLRLLEAALIGYFSPDGEILKEALLSTDVLQMDLDWALYLSTQLGQYFKYPVMLALLVMVVSLYFSHANLRFNKVYNMLRLAKQEQEVWPQICPVVELDLVKDDLNKGPWAMAMNPMQFAKQYKLIDVEMVADKKSPWKAEGVYKATVDKERAMRVFVSQLGPEWRGIDALPIYAQALFAVFAARVEHDPQTAAALLQQMARSAAKGSVDYTGMSRILQKHIRSKAVQRCVTRHAYVYTVMASMLELARTDGVLATADFLWLKPIDRKLWYILSCVGRRVAFPEVAGIFAHWLAEKEMGRPLYSPMIEEAIKGLELAMERTLYTPEEGENIPLIGAENG